MIDSHIHSDTRPYEDFENMAMYLDCAITLAHDPLKPYSMDVIRAHFDRIIYNEIERANKNGLKLFVCLGIHPRMIPPDVNYNMLREYLKRGIKYNKKNINKNEKYIVGVGEIGLEKCTREEIEVFEEQLIIAQELNLPAVVHTPRRNKKETTKTILEVINSLGLHKDTEKHMIIEHCTKETVPMIYDTNMNMGLTVQPSKLTPMDAVKIVKEYGGERFLLNSDSSSAPSNILGVPKTVLKMKINGVDSNIIKMISHNNAKNIFRLDV
ncbi:TatD family hydrolase [Methanothermococcus okinawensis]|uniref:TatD-related deoxyribonuclease n=1 Tax=Methanothermococcus okinawensis (strain DSM 14208 / JCM 11175 / IH1) TaxID=647113 RepID=F8AMH3_METOI|nr:TatD family hydrolase [Methanothermococcus okinawensis]AEH06013.1 TatD-related deoxyribonuclease [Methanothermococcus okinawensis IH1]